MEAILGIIVVGLIYGLFTLLINKGGEALSNYSNKEKIVPLTPEDEAFINKNNLFFERKNQWWLWVKDKEGHSYCVDYKRKDWTLRRVT